LISPDNVRPTLLPALLENPSVHEDVLVKFAISAARESIKMMFQSPRIKGSPRILDTLRSNPYLRPNESEEIKKLLRVDMDASEDPYPSTDASVGGDAEAPVNSTPESSADEISADESADVPDEVVSAYLAEHAVEIAEEEGLPFTLFGGIY